MALRLLPTPEEGHSRLLVGYEAGSVVLWAYDPARNQGRSTSVEGIGWTVQREWKIHVETSACGQNSCKRLFADPR